MSTPEQALIQPGADLLAELSEPLGRSRHRLAGCITALRRAPLLSCGVGVLLALSSGCDDRPLAAYAALPAPGAPVPEFALPALAGDSVRSAALRGAPTVLALWSTDCGASRLALQAIGRLHDRYATQGVHVVLLADDDDPVRLRTILDSARIALPTAWAAGTLRRRFDRSRQATERTQYRVAFALPSFLVLDGEGAVVARTAGVEWEEPRLRGLRQVVDSMLAIPGSS